MTPLSIYASSLGATIRPHPATGPVPGGGGALVVTPNDTWRCIDDLMVDEPRTDTSMVVLLAPGLHRPGFAPTVIATASIISPAVPADGLFEAVVMSMEGAEDWQVRARTDTGVDDDRTLDLLAEFRADGMGLALSSLVRARRIDGATVLHQVHVTTFADQIAEHSSGLAAVRIG